MSETGPPENPLVNNKKLRQIYLAMLEARLLDEHLAERQVEKKARRLRSTRGEEACRVGTAIELGQGDLISDSQVAVVMDLLFGEKTDSVHRYAAAHDLGKKQRGELIARDGVAGRELPWIEEAGERLQMVLGAALAFRTLKRPNVVVAYVHRGDVSKGVWRQVLSRSSKLDLPIIFVVLPELGDRKRKRVAAGTLSAKARSYGVPGIPVDASDAVALYRVAQESIGRTRGVGGPVLIECVAFRLNGDKRTKLVDPLEQMKSFLLGRKVCREAWLMGAEAGFRRRLEAATPGTLRR